AVLDGSIQKSGESISVSVRLFRVKDGKILWAQPFTDENLAGIFTMEDSIARRVVEELRLRLNEGEKQGLKKHDTRNVQAYLAYKLGSEYFYQHTRAGHIKAIEYYQTAIQKDPGFAAAHVALARIYSENSSPLPRMESQQKVESELRKALELDSNLAEAH